MTKPKECSECGSIGFRHKIGCREGGMPVRLINDMIDYDSNETIKAGIEGQVIGVWSADLDRNCVVYISGREVRCEISNLRRILMPQPGAPT